MRQSEFRRSARGILTMIAALLMLLPSSIDAQSFQTARQLSRQCEILAKGVKGTGRHILIPKAKDALQCWGYMQAMQDLSVLVDEKQTRIMGACPSERTTLLQLTRSFLAYARSHPGELDSDAALVVLRAFREAFPCPDSQALDQPHD